MPDTSSSCFHCGLPNPPGARFRVELDGHSHSVCCIGCKAVAELIRDSGLDRYYDLRDGVPGLQPPASAGRTDAFAELDNPDVLAELAQPVADGEREIQIHVDGMYCAACAWLLDTQLTRVPGVRSIDVNLMSSRLRLRWRPERTPLSSLLRTIAGLGYEPQPVAAGATAPQIAERRRALKRLFVAGIGMMQVMMFAVALYAGAFHGMGEAMQKFLRIISLVVATPVVLYAARPFFVAAWRGLRNRNPGMDVPVAIAIGAAFGASVLSTLLGGEDVWFDSVVMFVFFLSVARYVEMGVRQRATARAQALAQLLPSTATRLEDGVPHKVTLTSLREGDLVLLRPGESVPADGHIVEGSGDIDESMLTGESATRLRSVDELLIAGSINTNGNLTMRLSRVGGDTVLAAIAAMLDKAMSSRPRLVQLADRIAGYVVVALLLVASSTALAWYLLEPARAFEITLAVLVVTCPCALALATPAALAASSARLSELGFLITDQAVIETLAAADTLVFDKTGTLTTGRPVIHGIRLLGSASSPDKERCLEIAAALESRSAHPLAAAFAHIRVDVPVSDVVAVPGSGVAGTVGGRLWRIGRAQFVAPAADGASVGASDDNLSAVYLGNDEGLAAVFELRDELRPDGASAVAELERLGLSVSLASGDSAAPVSAVATRLNISDAHADLTPDAKLALLRTHQEAGRTVVMVGDGVNDAPVLAGADTSVAMAGGAMLARASAGAVLLGDSLRALPLAVATARKTTQIVRQNLTWAACYNLAAVPLAATGFVPPWLAAIGMSGSSLIVVLNALRLRRFGAGQERVAGERDNTLTARSLANPEAAP